MNYAVSTTYSITLKTNYIHQPTIIGRQLASMKISYYITLTLVQSRQVLRRMWEDIQDYADVESNSKPFSGAKVKRFGSEESGEYENGNCIITVLYCSEDSVYYKLAAYR
jgi:hypothetical protein